MYAKTISAAANYGNGMLSKQLKLKETNLQSSQLNLLCRVTILARCEICSYPWNTKKKTTANNH
jgi:hypothetical protein